MNDNYNNLLRAPEVPDADQVLCSSLKGWIAIEKCTGFSPSGKITKELSRNVTSAIIMD